MKVPEPTSQLHPLDGTALNQVKSDFEIVQDIMLRYQEDGTNASAIKIGDVWLSIPCRIVAVPEGIPDAEKNRTIRWREYHELNASQDGRQILGELGYKMENGMTTDPLEKFIRFRTSMENNARMSETVGRMTNLVVDNNGPAEKLFVLDFECTPQSIQNNIRPLMAQFLVAPFLPAHNADINRLAHPHDEDPEKYLRLFLAHRDPNGTIYFMPQVMRRTFATDEYKNETPVFKELMRRMLPSSSEEVSYVESPAELEEYFQQLAYWRSPFYVQLVDFTLKSKADKRSSFDFQLILRLVDPTPAFGGRPLFLKKESAVLRQMDIQEILEKARKGENTMTQRIAEMFDVKERADQDGYIDFSRISDMQDYNMFDPVFADELKDLYQEAVKDDGSVASPVLRHAAVLKKNKIPPNVHPWVVATPDLVGITASQYDDYSIDGIIEEINEEMGHDYYTLAKKHPNISWVPILGPYVTTQAAVYANNLKKNRKAIGSTLVRIHETNNEHLRVVGLPFQKKGQGIFDISANPDPRNKYLPVIKHDPDFKDHVGFGNHTSISWIDNSDVYDSVLDQRRSIYDTERKNTTVDRTDFTILQYNLRRFFADGDVLSLRESYPDHSYQSYDIRKRVFALLIARHNPDIVVLEELGDSGTGLNEIKDILNDQVVIDRYRKSEQGKYESIFSAPKRHALGDASIGIGLLTKFNIVGRPENIYLEDDVELMVSMESAFKDVPGDLRRKISTRPILKVIIEREQGNRMAIFACHFKSRLYSEGNPHPEKLRKYESRALMNAILKHNFEFPDMPYIVVGDFNYGYYQEPPDQELRDPGDAIVGFKNNVLTSTKNKKDRVYHTYRALRGGTWKTGKKLDDEVGQAFENTLDIIMCDDHKAMDIVANRPDTAKVVFNSKSIFDKYYRAVYSEHFSRYKSEDSIHAIRPFVMYSATASQLRGDSATNVRRYRKSKGTFYNEYNRDLENPWSVLDHILYSYHFFAGAKSNVSFHSGSIIDRYNDNFELIVRTTGDSGEITRIINRNEEVYSDGFIRRISNPALAPYPDGNITTHRLKEFKHSVLRPVEDFELRDFSDHFPVISSFKWSTLSFRPDTRTISLPASTRKHVVYAPTTGKFEANYQLMEFFPHPYVDESVAGRVLREGKKHIIAVSSRGVRDDTGFFNKFVSSISSTGIGGMPRFVSRDIAIDDATVIITGIFYSKLFDRYVFVAKVDKKETGKVSVNSIDNSAGNNAARIIREEVKKQANQKAVDRKTERGMSNTVFIVAKESDNHEIHNMIKNLVNDVYVLREKRRLANIFLTEFNAKHEESEYGSFEDDFRISMSLMPSAEEETGKVSTPTLNLDKFKGYFMYDEDVYAGFPPMNPGSDLAYNISQCVPFRNYYLPLLSEFNDAVEGFNWHYNFDIDLLSPFLYSYDSTTDTFSDTRLYFSRKLPSSSGRSVIFRIRNAVADLALLNEGSEEDKKQYLGKMAQQAVNGGSARISLLVQIGIGRGQKLEKIRQSIIDGIGSYKNVLIEEVLLSILVKMSHVQYLVDSEHETRISNMLRNEPSFEIKEQMWRGSAAATKSYIEDAVDHVAFGAMNSESLVSLQQERRSLEEYLIVESNYFNAHRVKGNDGDVDEKGVIFDVFTGSSGSYQVEAELNVKLKDVRDLFRNAREQIINSLAEVYTQHKEIVGFTSIT